MIATIRQVSAGDRHWESLVFWCPGCELMQGGGSGLHLLPVTPGSDRATWTFDGNLDAPTLNPSILTHGANDGRCHSYLRGGVLEFLDDCTHELAGQKVPLPELPAWVIDMFDAPPAD